MKDEKTVKIYEAKNGYGVTWPSRWFDLEEGRDVFYLKGFPGTKFPKDRFVVAEGLAIYDLFENLFSPKIDCHPRLRRDYSLLDVRGQETEAMEICRVRAYEIAKEKARGKYRILEAKRY